jgi:hypothetical protein
LDALEELILVIILMEQHQTLIILAVVEEEEERTMVELVVELQQVRIYMAEGEEEVLDRLAALVMVTMEEEMVDRQETQEIMVEVEVEVEAVVQMHRVEMVQAG